MKQSITLNRLGSSEEISGRMHESNEFLSFSVRYNKLLNTLLKLLLIPVLSMLSMTLSAQITFSAGGIYYITTGTNTVAVNKPFTPSQYYGVKVIPPTVSNNNISYTVTTIGERAFSDCIDLTDIKLPISLTMLSDYCFANCSSLLSINIPNSVDSIGKGAFQGCDQLYEISLPQKIRSISSNLFQGCSYLQTVNLPPNINSIGIRAFNKCWRLQSIIIPYGVSAIFQEAFEDSGLYEIHLPATLKYIGSDSFSLTQLRNVYVYATTPPNLDLEFSSTAQIYVPKGYLNEYLTAPNWRKIAPNNIREMDVLPGAIFTNAGINYKIKENNYVEVTAGNYTGNISIPRVVYYYGLSYTVSSIADSAFYNCTSLTSISIPFTVTSIGNHAFHACIGLKNVNFPTYSFNPEYYIKFSLLNSIGNYAFANCIILTEITLPPSVSSIGNYAFSGDHALKTINALPHDPPILGEFESINNELSAHSVFLDVNKNACKLYTPTGSKNLYKDALGWKDFSNMAEPVTLNPGSIFLVDNINYLVTEQSSVSVTKGGLYHDTISVPATVSYQGSVFNVTEIDTRAFADSTNLTCINLPISLTTIGYEAFKNCVGLTKIKLPDSLDSIADYAFNNCSNLSDSLQLPQSLKYIGILSFANCNQLTGNLTIPNSVQTIGLGAFQTCTGFKGQLTLPSIISKIPVNAFRSCQFTGSLTIPSSVTSIDQSAFIGNQFTGNLQIPSSVVAIGSEAFSGCNRFTSLNIPASVTSIGTFAFYFCSGLISVCDYNPTPLTLNKNAFGGVDQSICILTVPSGTKALYASADVWKDFKTINEIGQNNTDGATFAYNGINYLITSDNTVMVVSGNYSGNISIPQTVNNNSKDYQVTDIKEYAFSNNPNLTNVSLPSSVMHVGAGAFYKCSGLTGVILPASLATLDDFTFAYCNNLLTVNIPSTVRVIGNAVFQGCTNLNKVNIPSGVLLLGDQVFSGCSSISTVNIPGTINFLGDGVFEGCSSITRISIPTSITALPTDIFSECSHLSFVNLPATLTSIGDYAFEYCDALQNIEIPKTVKSIGDFAFQGSANFIFIKVNAISPDSIQLGSSVFDGVNKLTCILYVPVGSLQPFQSANQWKDFKNTHESASLIGEEFISDIYRFRITGLNTVGLLNNNYTGDFIVPSQITFFGTTYTVKSIEDQAFRSCEGLTTITLANTIISIGALVFDGNPHLKNIYIPASVANIAYGFIWNNNGSFIVDPANPNFSSLNGVLYNKDQSTLISCPETVSGVFNVPQTVTYIWGDAFYNCSKLTDIYVPASVTSLASNSFYATQKVNVDSNNLNYMSENGVLYNKNKTTIMHCPIGITGDFTIPITVTSIDEHTFEGCLSLNSINIPNGVSLIGSWGIAHTSITHLNLPTSLKTTGYMAFVGNERMTEVSMPAFINHFDQYLFLGCGQLKKVFIHAAIPPKLDNDGLFNDVFLQSNNTLYVPSGTKSLYESADVWNKFKNIVEIPMREIQSGNVNCYKGSDIVIPIKTNAIQPTDSVSSFQFSFNYDPEVLKFNGYVVYQQIASGTLLINNKTPGVLKIGYINKDFVAINGAFMNLQFTTLKSGITYPIIDHFLYNTNEVSYILNDTVTILKKPQYGDVDFNGNIQAYDASLVLQNSVGLDPMPLIDPIPWEPVRTEISDVNADGQLTAYDAGLILQRSIELIDSFPLKANSIKLEKIKTSVNDVDITVTLENSNLVFKSYGNLVGLNVSFEGAISLLGTPVIYTNGMLDAENITDQLYNIGLAIPVAPVDGTTLMTIPFKNGISDLLIVNLKVNTLDKVINFNSNSTGLNDVENNALNIYPNPATNEISFSQMEAGSRVDIISPEGKIVISEQVSTLNCINVSSLPQGLYLVSITSTNGQIRKIKLIKRNN